MRWTDGSLIHGNSASDVLAVVASGMWVSVDNPKAALAHRAWMYLGVTLDEDLPDEAFLKAMADAGMVEILNP